MEGFFNAPGVQEAYDSLAGEFYWPTAPFSSATVPTGNNTGAVINAASEKNGIILTVPSSGTLAGFEWLLGAVTTGATLDVRAESIDLTTGFPSGNLLAANTNGSVVVADNDDNSWKSATFTAGASVTKGDTICIVISNPAASFGDMACCTYFSDDTNFLMPYAAHFTNAWALLAAGIPFCALRYSGNVYVPVDHVYPFSSWTDSTYANSSTPDIIGAVFNLPAKARVTGYWVWADLDGDADIKLIGSDGATALATKSLDKELGATTGSGLFMGYFPETVELTQDVNYRLVVEPTSATSLTLHSANVSSAALMSALPGGADFIFTSAKNPTGTGDWTDVNTRRPFMGLLINAF